MIWLILHLRLDFEILPSSKAEPIYEKIYFLDEFKRGYRRYSHVFLGHVSKY